MARIKGSSFGIGPNVILYADFSGYPEGSYPPLDSPQIGNWQAFNYLTNLPTKVQNVFGRSGVQGREGGGNPSVDNRLTGFEAQFGRFKNFAVATDIAVPDGRTFPGASEPKTKSTVSSLKHTWLSDGPLDAQAKADCCVFSWTTASFAMVGNDSAQGVSAGSGFDFEGWNYFFGYACSGEDPFLTPGRVGVVNKSSQSNRVDDFSDRATYLYKTRIVVTAVANFNYQVVIDGVHTANYLSESSQTAAQIAQGLRAAIEALQIGVSTQIAGSAVTVVSAPFTKSECVGGPNLTLSDTDPWYTHFAYPAWQGNGSQTLAQTVSSYVYVAASDDDSVLARVVVIDSAELSTSTMYHVIPAESWTDEEIIVDDRYVREGGTHFAVFRISGEVSIFEIGILSISPPEIAGYVKVREEVSCYEGSYSSPIGPVTVVGYDWKLDGVSIGVDRPSLTLVDDAFGKMISCDVTVTDGVNTETFTAVGLEPVAGLAPEGSVSAIQGEPKVGKTLRVQVSLSSVPFAEVNIEWFRDGEPVLESTTTNAYIVRPADLGAMISARVIATNGISPDFQADVAAVGPVQPGDSGGGGGQPKLGVKKLGWYSLNYPKTL